MSKDIEDIFNSTFGQFEETPSERVWKGIAKDREEKQRLGITEATPEGEMTHGLANFAAEPGEGVWEAIAQNRFMKLMQRRMLRLAAALLLLLGIGLAANSLIKKDGKVEAGSARQEVVNGTSEESGGKQEAENSTQGRNGSQQPQSNGQPSTGNSSQESQQTSSNGGQSKAGSEQSAGSGKQHGVSNPQSLDKGSNRTTDQGQQTTDNSEPTADNGSIVVVTKNPVALPTAKPDMSKLPKPRRLNSPHKDHFVYIPTTVDGKKSGSNYTKYNKETDLNNEASLLKFGLAIGSPGITKLNVSGDSTYYQRMRSVGYEGQMLSFAGSFFVNCNIFKRVYLQTGANLVRRWASPDYDASFGHQVMTVSGQGNTTYVDVIDYKIHAKANYHLTHLELPIMIGASFGEKRMSIHGQVGPSYNLLIGKGGNMLSAMNMQVMPLNDKSAHNFAKGAWGWTAAVGGAVQIKHELSIIFDVVGRLYNKNMFASGYPATQTMKSIGVNVGVRYHLN